MGQQQIQMGCGQRPLYRDRLANIEGGNEMKQTWGMQTGTNYRILFPAIFCLLTILLLDSVPLEAAPDITARYRRSDGRELQIEITIGSPPPSSAILIQNLPAGVEITQSSPKVNNYSPGKNVAKWLFRDLTPGKKTVHITLNRPVSSSDISAELRYKPARGGSMTSIGVQK